jgi:transcriptional regulator with XRE-family HTH domain
LAARKKTVARKPKPRKASQQKVASKGRTAAPGARSAQARDRRPVRSASLADRLIELVEHAAAGTLRRVVDGGGRELAGWLPDAPEMRREAGSYLRELRELAGLTVEELSEAVELSDDSLLEAVESGAATLSFELILRLAAILARHDPAPFISRMVRSYNPVLGELLEDWGVGRLPLQFEREREFVNILRGRDEARDLSEPEFARVLEFTRAAFELALEFTRRSQPGRVVRK